MNKYNDLENVAINNIQYSKKIQLEQPTYYDINDQRFLYGITLEIHDDGTSQFAHKETEQYAHPSGEQVYVVQTDTNDYI